MKKILFCITDLEMGGAEKVLVDLVNSLCNEYKIEILTIYSNGILEKELNPKIKINSLYNESFKNLSFIKRKYISLKIRLKSYRNKVYKKFCNDKDLVISFLEGPVTKLLCDLKTYKIAWIHTDLSNHYKNKNKNKLEKDYEKYDKLIFVSDSSKQSFDKLFENKFVNKEIVINNYIDKERIINKSKEKIDFEFKSPNFLVIARLVEAKGLERLINIHTLLLKYNLKHYIYVIGDGPLKNKLENLIKENNISNSFILLGQKENPYPYLNKCDIFLLPSLYEGYGMVALEAKILNKRIITTKTGVVDALSDYENKIICENNEIELYKVLKDELEKRFDNKKVDNHIFNNDEILDKIKKILEGEKND